MAPLDLNTPPAIIEPANPVQPACAAQSAVEQERAETVAALRRIPGTSSTALAPVTEEFRQKFFEDTVVASEKALGIVPQIVPGKEVFDAIRTALAEWSPEQMEKERSETVEALHRIPSIEVRSGSLPSTLAELKTLEQSAKHGSGPVPASETRGPEAKKPETVSETWLDRWLKKKQR